MLSLSKHELQQAMAFIGSFVSLVRACAVFCTVSCISWSALPAAAHFQLNVNIRVVHVEHLDDGLRLYLRLPTPYVLAPLIGEAQPDGTVAPAPYTANRTIEGELFHALDWRAIGDDPLGLGELVGAGFQVTQDGQVLQAEVEATRVYSALTQPPFATLEEARRAFATPFALPGNEEVFVGDSVTDVMLRYRTGAPVYAFSLGSTLDPGLPEQDKTANLILDHFGGESLVFRESGLLATPIEISRSPLKAALGFVWEGIIHILKGLDHVLFVLCLSIGALRLGSLIWRITGFTLGHTVTLIVGFFGFVPQAAWFIPLVETGIALSIVYAGVIALLDRQGASSIVVTAALGLLHGLGFSFVLHEILSVDSPNLWQSLLAFNLGVEIGQVALVLAVWPLFWWLGRINMKWATAGRWAVVLPAMAVAAAWTGERALQVIETL